MEEDRAVLGASARKPSDPDANEHDDDEHGTGDGDGDAGNGRAHLAGLDAAKKVAAGAVEGPDKDGRLTDDAAVVVEDATAWLLETFDHPEKADITHTMKLDVGSPAKPRWIPWTIKAVAGTELRRIRGRAASQLSQGGQRRRGGQEVDAAYAANLQVVLAGTLDPDVPGLAMERGIADATHWLDESFRNKPGLIEQIAGEIYALSGYDEESVRDLMEVEAASSS